MLCSRVQHVTRPQQTKGDDSAHERDLLKEKAVKADRPAASPTAAPVLKRGMSLNPFQSGRDSKAADVAVDGSRPRRLSGEGRRRSSSNEEYEGRLEMLVFGPNNKQRHVPVHKKSMKSIVCSDKPICGLSQEDLSSPQCTFGFSVQGGVVHPTHVAVAISPPPAVVDDTESAPLQFYTSPSTLHSGMSMDGAAPFPRSPFSSSRATSPGMHVRMSFLQRVERAPEIEPALMYGYLANMKEHSVEAGGSSFRAKAAALQAADATIPLVQAMAGQLDLTQGALAIGVTHDMRHFGSGGCILTIKSDGTVLVLPPAPRIDRLDAAVSAQSPEALLKREQAQAFEIPVSKYLDAGQDGMVTSVACSSNKIRFGVTALLEDDQSQTSAYIVEFGPINPKLPWQEQFDKLELKKHDLHDEERLKRGVTYSSGASVSHITCGESYSIALMSDGSLWTWGTCTFGSLGHGKSVESLPKPKKITGQPSRFVSVVSGVHHVVARCSNFDFYVWGSNQRGQLGIAKEKDSSHEKVWSPRKMSLMVMGQGVLGISQVTCGDYHTALLTTTGDFPSLLKPP